jgi:hypothetical protein
VTDNGRVAMDMISESVRSGGAMACNGTNSLRSSPVSPNLIHHSSLLPKNGLLLDYVDAFSGFEAAGTSPLGGTAAISTTPATDGAGTDWAGPGGVALDALLLGKVVQGNDVLAVRQSDTQNPPVYTTQPYTAGAVLHINQAGNLQPLQYAVISECSVSIVFQINNVDPVGLQITTNGPLDGGGALGMKFDPRALISAVDMRAYYIAPGRDGDSALFDYDEWTGAFQELVPDIENMQVLYGVTTSASSDQVTEYVTADQVVDFNQVAAVKVALLAASAPGAVAAPQPPAAPVYQLLDTSVTAPLDARLRKVFETTIAVRNATL